MADRSDVVRRLPRAPLRLRSRKRWAVVAGIAGVWALFLAGTGSLVVGTALLLMVTAFVVVCAVALRCLGIDGDHPWVRRMATRPWRDGPDVLRLGLRHLPEIYIITPSGSLLAPSAVELLMNPGDLVSLTEMMDLDLINSSASEVYETQVAAHGVRLASVGPVQVSVIGDPAVPAGRYRLRQARQGRQSGAAQPDGPVSAHAVFGRTRSELAATRTIVTDPLTVAESASVPVLRLVTNGSVAQTRVSGARVGRGSAVELVLPDEPTVSRVHAALTFTNGRWWITSLGRNGVTLNGTLVAGEHAMSDGDCVRWGTQPDALMSQVEISSSLASVADRRY